MVELRIEPINFLLENGLKELSYKCWQQVGSGLHASQYRPDWSCYKNLEDRNNLRFIAMRDGGELIGYSSVLLDTDMHNEGMKTATIMDVFIDTERSGHAVKLFRFIEQILLQLGIDYVTVAEQLHVKPERGGVGRFYRFMGYEPQQVNWSKRLGQDGSA